ncbi:nucleoside deaminase [Diplocloster agilis]|uniref:nucleoside deaminase n=1 Tax=Diplocloster agilis TaxID=2850323 RepID=UPI000820C691|nr:Guanine deaminase [uncultured Clostridium sp.]
MAVIKEYDERFSGFDMDRDILFLKRAIKVSENARLHGNTPFGAILVDQAGEVLMEQENMEVTQKDCTLHAELGLIRRASRKYTKEYLWTCSLYSSCEPCAMCSGGVYWANIGRIVYAMAESDLYALNSQDKQNPSFNSSCRNILEKGEQSIVIVGPVEEVRLEALKVHEGYWNTPAGSK